MPGAALMGTSMSSGHDCFPPQNAIQGSPTVLINGIPAHCFGDAWSVHCCPKKGCHPGFLASGSVTVYINGLQAGRVGDVVGCGPGDTVISGSSTVLIGG